MRDLTQAHATAVLEAAIGMDHDPVARQRDLEFEGIVAEVIFHGSQNDEPVPFQSSMLGAPAEPELAAATSGR